MSTTYDDVKTSVLMFKNARLISQMNKYNAALKITRSKVTDRQVYRQTDRDFEAV